MTPRVDFTAFTVAASLATGVLPALPMGHYSQGTAMVSASLLAFIGQEMDRAVARRVAEIERMKALLADGAALAGPTGEAWLSVCKAEVPSLSVAALDACRAPLLGALLELHVWLEEQSSVEARALEARLLDHILQTANAKALVLPAMG